MNLSFWHALCNTIYILINIKVTTITILKNSKVFQMFCCNEHNKEQLIKNAEKTIEHFQTKKDKFTMTVVCK